MVYQSCFLSQDILLLIPVYQRKIWQLDQDIDCLVLWERSWFDFKTGMLPDVSHLSVINKLLRTFMFFGEMLELIMCNASPASFRISEIPVIFVMPACHQLD